MKRDSGTVTVGYEEGLANQLPFMHPTLVGRVRRCKRRVNWFNSNWMLHLVAKPDKRAGIRQANLQGVGPVSKTVGVH